MHRIDPRIVIIQIVLSGICAFWIFKPLAMLCEVIFLMSFLLYLQHPKEALRLGVWFAFLVGLYALLNESNAPQIIVQPVFLLRKLSPLLGVMVLSLKALTVSELFMGLQKLHCPKSATLALAVAYTIDFDVTPHQLRHTYITNLLYAGVNPKTVQYLAGHENSKTTMDIYAKVKYNKPEELFEVVNDALHQRGF